MNSLDSITKQAEQQQKVAMDMWESAFKKKVEQLQSAISESETRAETSCRINQELKDRKHALETDMRGLENQRNKLQAQNAALATTLSTLGSQIGKLEDMKSAVASALGA